MERKVRVGFAGTGYMGQLAHLKNYVEIPDCEVVALAEYREELGKNVAAKYNIPKVYRSIDEMLDNEDLDAVVCAQNFHLYDKMLPKIFKRGVAVFSEKPMAVSVEAGERLAKCAKENNCLYWVGYHKRSDPAMEYAKKVIDEWKASGEYGDMKYIRITMPGGDWVANMDCELVRSDEPFPEMKFEDKLTYFDDKGNEDYISFINFYIHQVNGARFLLGEDYKLTFADKYQKFLAFETETGVSGILEMATYSNTTDWAEEYMVCFEKGYVLVELRAPLTERFAGKVTVMKDKGANEAEIVKPILPRVHAFKHQAENFIKAVKGEIPVRTNPEDAVKDLMIAKDYITMFREALKK
ncbi:MAG: Gfo/Idh/MocA family oxidoreductase [Armatimonadetes bacterium]|nr:Gfo/Idh/MocA family oxidoreductase [Candidatus Hippobium faecium]